MRKLKKSLAIFLSTCILLSMMIVYSTISASASSAGTYTYTQIGNSGAKIVCSSGVSYASVDNTSVASVTYSDKTVTVTGVKGAVGIAVVTVYFGGTLKNIEVPIGYTTFSFDNDTLTVFEGSDTKYEITGINALNEEYSPESSTDSDGNAVYSNTSTYSLLVNVNKKGGTYVFTGSSDDMAISVKKEATGDAALLLCGLDLTSSFTSPLTVKKDSTASVTVTALAGHDNTLTDADFNNADTYGDTADGGNGTNAEYAESAVIKGKDNANITLNGTGTLNLVCNTKNAVKVNEYGALTIEDLTLNITSAKNGISADNTITVNSGTITVDAEADAIRTDPDAVDANAGCVGNIIINGGIINIEAGSDGIQSAQDISITAGTFDIKTGSGYNDSSFNSDTMSCKGIKASYSSDSDETTDTSESTNTITITGGTFNLNTADDSIHSDGYAVIEGGEFTIYTGDDGVHADTSLTLGKENGTDCGVQIKVTSCYEGLEAGNIYVYSGSYDVIASDDGINAAGGNGGDTTGFNPGGGPGGPGNQGGQGGFNPGGQGGNPGGQGSKGDYSINIYGGLVNVNASGDGIDSNGNLNITGGTVISWGAAANNPDDPLDADGDIYIKGATVFAAGSSQMAEAPSSSSQGYVTTKSTAASGKTINIKNSSSTTVFNAKAKKNVNYILYSSPDMTSSSGWSITIDDSSVIDTSENFAYHSWNGGTVTKSASCTTDGIITYTCTSCGATKISVISATGHTASSAVTETDSDGCTYSVVHCSTCNAEMSRTQTGSSAAALVNNSTISSTSITLGSSITVTGAASGGTSPYYYAVYYKLSTASSYTTAQNYSTTKTVTITPSEAGTYSLVVKVKDGSGTVSRKELSVTVASSASTLINNSTLSSTSITLGSSIAVTGAASGGTSPYYYSVYYKLSTASSYITAQNYSTTKSVTITPSAAGTYSVVVKVKDSAGTVCRKAFTAKVTASTLTNNSTVSASSITLGSSVKITASATGGTSPYYYAVFYKKSTSSSYTTAQNYSTTRTVIITPGAAVDYSIVVKVKDSTGAVSRKEFTVSVSEATALANNSTISSTAVAQGKSITVTGAATGGTSPYYYAVYYKLSTASSYTTAQSYSTTKTVTVTPTEAGEYSVVVKVKDSTGSVSRKEFTVTVSASALKNSSTISSTSIKLGKSVTITCAASGGTSPYYYAVYYKKASSSTYSTAQSYSTTKTVSITPGSATTYTVVVKVRDNTGTVKEKTFSVTVTE